MSLDERHCQLATVNWRHILSELYSYQCFVSFFIYEVSFTDATLVNENGNLEDNSAVVGRDEGKDGTASGWHRRQLRRSYFNCLTDRSITRSVDLSRSVDITVVVTCIRIW